jgi:transcriptional regulator with XRE-family HTH domain
MGRKQLPRQGSLSVALGETIRAHLAGSQAGLASEIGVSLRTLERWLSGERPMPVDSLYAIADALGTTAADLVTEAQSRRTSDDLGLAAHAPGTEPGTETDEGHTP